MKTLIAVHHERIAPKDKIVRISGDYNIEVFSNFDALSDYLKDNPCDILCLDPDITHFDLPKERLQHFKGIKHLILHSTSVDYIDLEACVDLGIKVYPVPSYATYSTAEFALSMIFDGVRFKPLYENQKNDLNMDLEARLFNTLSVGIIGLGNIGTALANQCTKLGATVNYWSRNNRHDLYNYMELETLFSQSDVIISTIERSKSTVELLKKQEFIDLMKPSSLVVGINGSRETLDEECIIKKVMDKKLQGYIFEGNVEGFEPKDFEGYNIKNYSLAAWYTQSSLAMNAELYVSEINKILTGDTSASVENDLERNAL